MPPRGKTRELVADWAGVSGRTVQDASLVHANDSALFAGVKAGKLSVSTTARRVRRTLRDANLPPAPPLPEGPFQVVYGDPPWRIANPDGAHAPENHYPTLPTAEIAALNVPAAEHAFLALWAVNSLLPAALAVMAAWGFDYLTNIVWVKPSIGLGRRVRNRHELLLLGQKGNLPAPDLEDLPTRLSRHHAAAIPKNPLSSTS